MAKTRTIGGVNGRTLRSFVNRIENLNKQIKDLSGGRTEVFAEAKEGGFDPKTIRRVLRERDLTPETRALHLDDEALFANYWQALGMTPIEELAASAREAAEAASDEADEAAQAAGNGADAGEAAEAADAAAKPKSKGGRGRVASFADTGTGAVA